MRRGLKMKEFDEILTEMAQLEYDLTQGELEYITKLEKWYLLRVMLAKIQGEG